MHGDWQIITPANWSYKVTTKTTGPSIVITNNNLEVVDQVRIGILSAYLLEITELKAYTNCGKKIFHYFDFKCVKYF
jgi:hypothetical protein